MYKINRKSATKKVDIKPTKEIQLNHWKWINTKEEKEKKKRNVADGMARRKNKS